LCNIDHKSYPSAVWWSTGFNGEEEHHSKWESSPIERNRVPKAAVLVGCDGLRTCSCPTVSFARHEISSCAPIFLKSRLQPNQASAGANPSHRGFCTAIKVHQEAKSSLENQQCEPSSIPRNGSTGWSQAIDIESGKDTFWAGLITLNYCFPRNSPIQWSFPPNFLVLLPRTHWEWPVTIRSCEVGFTLGLGQGQTGHLASNPHFAFTMPEKKDTLVYIKHPKYSWVPAKLDRQEGDKAYVTVPQYKDQQSIVSDGGKSAKKSIEEVVDLNNYPHKVLPLQNVDANGNLTEFPDMVQLSYLHEVRSTMKKPPDSICSLCPSRLVSFTTSRAATRLASLTLVLGISLSLLTPSSGSPSCTPNKSASTTPTSLCGKLRGNAMRVKVWSLMSTKFRLFPTRVLPLTETISPSSCPVNLELERPKLSRSAWTTWLRCSLVLPLPLVMPWTLSSKRLSTPTLCSKPLVTPRLAVTTTRPVSESTCSFSLTTAKPVSWPLVTRRNPSASLPVPSVMSTCWKSPVWSLMTVRSVPSTL